MTPSKSLLQGPHNAAVFSHSADERHILDLSEAVRQYAIIGVPMKVLCREECAGLCMVCGKNLNEGSCYCKSETRDPEWISQNLHLSGDSFAVQDATPEEGKGI